jgi:hypothetical protein
MVGLTGELRGVLMFSCDGKSAVRITSKMRGVPLPGADGTNGGGTWRGLQYDRGELQTQS